MPAFLVEESQELRVAVFFVICCNVMKPAMTIN